MQTRILTGRDRTDALNVAHLEWSRVWLIANPLAGRKAGITLTRADPDDAQAALARRGVHAAETRTTEREGDAALAAHEAVAAGADLIVVAGGDGTVHDAAGALVGTDTALGILPLGTAMNIARALNIPRALEEAAALITDGQVVRMDVGRAHTAAAEDYFLELAGVGVDAGVMAYARQLERGNWRWLLPLLRFALRYRPRPVRVVVDGSEELFRACHTVTVAIGPFAGAALSLAPHAKVDDRRFDVVVREGFSRTEFARHVFTIAWGRRADHPKAQTRRGRRVTVDGLTRPLAVHADGIPLGTTPARFELLPSALSVLVGRPPADGPSAVRGPIARAIAPDMGV
jgi:diacylglycerol kinase (ATP)